MKKISLFAMTLALAFALGTPMSMQAAEETTEAAKTEVSDASKPMPFHGKISAVDAAAKTFTIQGKESSRVFTITDTTKLAKAGAPATWADLIAGEAVRGRALKKSE